MSRSSLLRTFFLGVLIVATWVLFVAFYLFGRQGILLKINYQNSLLIITGTIVKEEAANGDQQPEIRLNGLNQHTWEKPCQINLEQLCNYPIFPKAPDNRTFAEKIDVFFSNVTVAGIRLIGFLRPNISGEYYFLVASNGVAEVWLSLDKNWRKAQKAAYTNPHNSSSAVDNKAFKAIKSQISDGMFLYANYDYYFEVIYAQGIHERKEHLIQVAWKRPEKKRFEIIVGDFLTPYKKDSHLAYLQVYDDDLPEVPSCRELRFKYPVTNKYMEPETLPYLEHAAVARALDFCEYRPSYLLKPANLSNFRKYHGVHRHTHKISGYPFPNVMGVKRARKLSVTFIGEYPLDAKEAMSVVSQYFEALKQTYPGKYQLMSTRRVEKKDDPLKGSRYFLELEVKDLTDGASYILAEYVFRPKEKNYSLCYPIGLQWNRTADVYLILTAKKLGRWVHHFIKNVEKVIQETKDEHIHVVIYDFESPDTGLKKQVLEKSSLKKYHFITKTGNYSRTISFSDAIQSIKDPNAIVVTVDLHLDIGSRLINDIRKHCIKRRMVYAPQIVFLNCDGSSALPRGFWYHYSYGTIATYKQDWDNFGGFSKDFLNKITWGGEDWDIIDGAVKGGLEIERKRSPWIYHYYHSKKGMWQKKNVNKTALAKGNPKTGLAAKKLPPMVKTPPKKEISTKTKGVAQNKATPLHKDRNLQNKVTSHQTQVSSGKQAHLQTVGKSPKELSAQKGPSQKKAPIQNKALNKKDTDKQKDISFPRQVILQKENHSPKETSPKNKDLPNIKAPLYENVESQNNVHNQKQPHDWKDGSHEKELHANRNIISPKKVLPQKKHVDHPKQTYKQTSQKQAHPQQKVVSQKEVQLQH